MNVPDLSGCVSVKQKKGKVYELDAYFAKLYTKLLFFVLLKTFFVYGR